MEINGYAISTGDRVSFTDVITGQEVEGVVEYRARMGWTVTLRLWNSLRGTIEAGLDLYGEATLIEEAATVEATLI